MFVEDYKPPALSTDSVIFQIIDNELFVLLINRAKEPFKGVWALPGGYNAGGETMLHAMTRVLKLKAGVNTKNLRLIEQLYTFDSVSRDPRGHAVSVVYIGLAKDLVPEGTTSIQSPQFFSVNQLPELAFDHQQIVKYAHKRLASKLTYTNAVFALLDKFFTLSQLQTVYEAILGRSLDKRNFRKKFLSLDLVEPTNEYMRDGAYRPARLYKFKQQSLQELERSFD